MPCECRTCTCERVRTARLTCASAALRGALAVAALAVTALRGALAVVSPPQPRDTAVPPPINLPPHVLHRAATVVGLRDSPRGSRRDSPRGSRSRAAIDAPRHPVLDANLLAAVATSFDDALLAAVAIAVDAALLAAVAAALLAAVATSFAPPVFLRVHAAHGSAAEPARDARPSLVPRVSAWPHSSALRTARRDNGLIAGGAGGAEKRVQRGNTKKLPSPLVIH